MQTPGLSADPLLPLRPYARGGCQPLLPLQPVPDLCPGAAEISVTAGTSRLSSQTRSPTADLITSRMDQEMSTCNTSTVIATDLYNGVSIALQTLCNAAAVEFEIG